MLDHPVVVPGLKHRVHRLLRAFVEVDSIYWVDMLDPVARVRLTNIFTGQYVIFGQFGAAAPIAYQGYVDEYYGTVISGPDIRVRLAHNTFSRVSIVNDTIPAWGSVRKIGLRFSHVGTQIEYFPCNVTDADIDRVRMIQHAVTVADRPAKLTFAA